MEADVANNGSGALEGSGAARPAAVSLLRYSPALVFFIIAIADVGRWADPDLWGHIRFGQLTLALGHAPVRNPYSYSSSGYIWRDPEWLAEALLALSFDALGIIGEVLELNVNTVKVRLFRARGRLVDIYRKRLDKRPVHRPGLGQGRSDKDV